mmetsp:Transcript_40196/g.95501  ORF Transcript_40196/g.95501 Transcript_40196/m.95501 type:complete len:327 (-) Transcript_40196:940-1920(-)
MLGSVARSALKSSRILASLASLSLRSLRSRSRMCSAKSSSCSLGLSMALNRASFSKRCLTWLKRVPGANCLHSSSIVVKSSRACRRRRRASSFSSRFRCWRYSLKQAFFSPKDLSAPYLLSEMICRMACSHVQSELQPTSRRRPLNASFASALVAYWKPPSSFFGSCLAGAALAPSPSARLGSASAAPLLSPPACWGAPTCGAAGGCPACGCCGCGCCCPRRERPSWRAIFCRKSVGIVRCERLRSWIWIHGCLSSSWIEGRLDLSLDSARRMKSTASSDIQRGNCGYEYMMHSRVAARLSRSNGGNPTRSSYARIPTDHTSTCSE